MNAAGVKDDAPDLIGRRLAAFGEVLYGFALDHNARSLMNDTFALAKGQHLLWASKSAALLGFSLVLPAGNVRVCLRRRRIHGNV